MNFDSRSLLLAIIVVIFSIVNYTILRDMIYGILLGSHKKKTSDKIVAQQKFMQKLTQRYVGANITRHEKAYAKWINIKLAHFLFCIVQLVGLGLVIFLTGVNVGFMPIGYKLGTQLPYLFIINRLAHYIKVLQREQLGSWKERSDLERELNTWIRQYVADQENPPADVRSRKPLRAAKVEVMDVEGEPGWYQVALSVRPHFKFMGANFELSLVGRLDRE